MNVNFDTEITTHYNLTTLLLSAMIDFPSMHRTRGHLVSCPFMFYHWYID